MSVIDVTVLSDAEVLAAFEEIKNEMIRRFPGSAYTPTPEELADPELLMRRLAETEAACRKRHGEDVQ